MINNRFRQRQKRARVTLTLMLGTQTSARPFCQFVGYPGRPRGGLTIVPSRHLFQQVPTPIGGLCKSATPAPRWLAPLGASEHPLPLGRSVEKHFRVRRLGCPSSHPPTSHPSTPRSCISSGVAWLTSHVMRPSLGSNQSLLLRRVASRSHLLLSRQSRLLTSTAYSPPKGPFISACCKARSTELVLRT